MHIFKKALTSVLVGALLVMPYAHAQSGPYSTVEEVKLSDNPLTFLEAVGYVALFLVTAYIMRKMIPPLPPEEVQPEPTLLPSFDALPATTLETSDVEDDAYSDDYAYEDDSDDEYDDEYDDEDTDEDDESEDMFFE